MGGQTTNATTPTPPQTPWTPNVNDPYNGGEQYGGDQAGAGAGEGGNDGGWRPGVEDGALKSEEGDMEGQGYGAWGGWVCGGCVWSCWFYRIVKDHCVFWCFFGVFCGVFGTRIVLTLQHVYI